MFLLFALKYVIVHRVRNVLNELMKNASVFFLPIHAEVAA
jgi:putative effector of murein hydrolase LrgA (UPF0299 family)